MEPSVAITLEEKKVIREAKKSPLYTALEEHLGLKKVIQTLILGWGHLMVLKAVI